MPEIFKITEIKRVSDNWEIKATVPNNMFGFSTISMKVEAEKKMEEGGMVERELSDIIKAFHRRVAYDFQRLADIAFDKLDKESIDMVREALIAEAAHGDDRSIDVN